MPIIDGQENLELADPAPNAWRSCPTFAPVFVPGVQSYHIHSLDADLG